MRSFHNKEESKVKARTTRLTNNKHVSDFSKYQFNQELLLDNFNKSKENLKVNWTKLAVDSNLKNENNVTPNNAGQVAKEWIKSKGLDLSWEKERAIIRRHKVKGPGGEISMPCEPTEKKLKSNLKEMIANNLIKSGELVNPKLMEKLKISEGQLIKHQFTISARKIPLLELRKNSLKENFKYMRLQHKDYYEKLTYQECLEKLSKYTNKQELSLSEMREKIFKIETTRHFILWHDASTIANHGYIMFMVGNIYDTSVYYTREEWKQMHSENIDIQNIIEEPYLYIAGRSSSTDQDQLQYCETRRDCLEQMNVILLTEGMQPIYDVMRFFKGDGPAIAFEVGHQKGGIYLCSSCPIHSSRSKEFDHCHYLPNLNLKEKQSHILKGVISSKNTIKKHGEPLNIDKLCKQDIQEELRSRGILKSLNLTKEKIKAFLKSEMKGTKRVPAILFETPVIDLKEIYSEHYEICQFEPMHDIAKHIENILTEIPFHLENETKQQYNDIIDLAYGSKSVKRCCDHRLALLKVIKSLSPVLPFCVKNVLVTLAEIQAIVYQEETERTNSQILRLYNKVFLHYIHVK